MESLREIYRIGPGPSSSHTMGPARAAAIYRARNQGAVRFRVTLYGSLAATGRGHLTDEAVMQSLGKDATEIVWLPESPLPAHPNGLKFESWDADGAELPSWVCYSIGGGALREDGGSAETKDVYPFANMAEILAKCASSGLPMWQLVEDAEGSDIVDHLENVLRRMESAMECGLRRDGVLPGGLRLPRRARSLYLKARLQDANFRRTGLVSAYATAVSEENASLGTVVTAPTCGSCGVLPAVLRYLRETLGCEKAELVHALEIAGLFGTVVKQNGSISGAEVGCQGEIGVACAMAAAAAAYLYGGTAPQCETAAEIGLEHFLGLTCDPVLGLVQVPCIERNALAANRALVAAEMALLSDGRHLVSFDDVVQTMLQTGHDLPSLYRETSAGGLAARVRV
ncbi:MAG: L-serine ammonia-lyase [Kiritimatiellae bacterium]|nr:L-serine ammonia-lyase [Kiritimatiellia bacterium]